MILILGAVIVLLSLALIFTVSQYLQLKAAVTVVEPQSVKVGTDKIKEDIKNWVVNNISDTPSIIEVLDAEQFKAANPALYVQVQEGDLTFIYPDKLVIFRPSDHKFVLITPLN